MKRIEDIVLLGFFQFLLMGSLSSCSSSPEIRLHDIDRCDISPRFHHIVENELGPDRVSKASYGLAVLEQKSGKVICEDYLSKDQIVYPASSIKTLVAVAVLRKVDQGILRMEDERTITQSNADAECKYWDCARYAAGKKATVEGLLRDMITVSNNIATNQLIETASKPFIDETASVLGAPSLKIYRRLYDDVNPDPEIKERNTASAFGLVQLYREVSTGYLHVLKESSRQFLVDLLQAQKYHNYLDARFPKSVAFRHKTGGTSISSSDGGFFYAGHGTVIVLVGLQNFRDSKPLQKIGESALTMVSQL